MHQFSHFGDLRQNAPGHTSEISLWPTFTDIMTVILMIFMITMIVVIIKNSSLSRELTSSQEKEEILRELSEKHKVELADLKAIATALEEKLQSKELEIILLGDENEIMRSSLEGKLAVISALEDNLRGTAEKADTLEANLREKEAEAARIRSESERRMNEISEETERRIEEFNQKFAALVNELNEKKQTILVLNTERQSVELALAKQRKEHSILEEKYNRLIGPSRSPLGKTLVTVQYFKKEGAYHRLLKDSDAADFEQMTSAQLHQKLGLLKEKLKDNLYVKIIIPEDSGLSYNEAWSFTKDLLNRYDYYYQSKPTEGVAE